MYHSLMKPKQTHKGHDKHFMSKNREIKTTKKKKKKSIDILGSFFFKEKQNKVICLLDTR